MPYRRGQQHPDYCKCFSCSNRNKTHCKNGHALSGENLYTNRSGSRVCRACSRASARTRYCPERQAQKNRNFRNSNPYYRLEDHLNRAYGIQLDEYQNLVKKQGGVCRICHNKCNVHKRLSVDHDHSTGLVRGLLCNECNAGLGRFKDNPGWLRNAADYIETFAKTLQNK